jgi:transposase
MIWFFYSLDLNPIKNFWVLIKTDIYKLYPELEFADNTKETLQVLIVTIRDA